MSNRPPTYRVTVRPHRYHPDQWVARFIEPCECGMKHTHGAESDTHGQTSHRVAHCRPSYDLDGRYTADPIHSDTGYYIEVHNPPNR